MHNKIILAQQHPIIKQEQPQKISDTLLKIFVMLGINRKNYPDATEMVFLCTSTIDVLGDFTCGDIETAFEMAMRGDLRYELNLYDKMFSIVFLSGLMKEYKQHKFDAMHAYNKKMREIQYANKKSPEEIAELNKKALEKIFNKAIDIIKYDQKSGEYRHDCIDINNILFESLKNEMHIDDFEMQMCHEAAKRFIKSAEYARASNKSKLIMDSLIDITFAQKVDMCANDMMLYNYLRDKYCLI